MLVYRVRNVFAHVQPGQRRNCSWKKRNNLPSPGNFLYPFQNQCATPTALQPERDSSICETHSALKKKEPSASLPMHSGIHNDSYFMPVIVKPGKYRASDAWLSKRARHCDKHQTYCSVTELVNDNEVFSRRVKKKTRWRFGALSLKFFIFLSSRF